MDKETRELVRRRAGDRCEYCGIRQEDEPFYRLHVEHIIARQHLGGDETTNLALACHHCNFHKGPNLSAIDPTTRQIVQLFDPRGQRWSDHFDMVEGKVTGRTAVGRATELLLRMNVPSRVTFRKGS